VRVEIWKHKRPDIETGVVFFSGPKRQGKNKKMPAFMPAAVHVETVLNI
jgi:hypothetical protein